MGTARRYHPGGPQAVRRLTASRLLVGGGRWVGLVRWRCALTDVAARYTDGRADNFDIYLPRWLARHNKELFGGIFVAGLLVLLWRWLRRRSCRARLLHSPDPGRPIVLTVNARYTAAIIQTRRRDVARSYSSANLLRQQRWWRCPTDEMKHDQQREAQRHLD